MLLTECLNKMAKKKGDQKSNLASDNKSNGNEIMLFNTIQSIEIGSHKIITWSLSIIGGSVLTIISDSYYHPNEVKLKAIYLLFIAGWSLIGLSIYNGKEIMGRAMAAQLYKNNYNRLKAIFTKCNKNYSLQIRYFNLGLLIFGIWLLLFLFWWVLQPN